MEQIIIGDIMQGVSVLDVKEINSGNQTKVGRRMESRLAKIQSSPKSKSSRRSIFSLLHSMGDRPYNLNAYKVSSY